MKTFTPGIIVHDFITKNGQEATIRYPQPSDLQAITDYANTLSAEDTYVTLSGEQLSLEEEQTFLDDEFHKIEDGDGVMLLCTIDGMIVGNSGITRDTSGRNRSLHVGIFGISIHKNYRGQGLGYELAKTVIDQAKVNMDGIRIVKLSVYEPNLQARELYKSLGFIEFGTLPEGILYKEGYLDEVYMYKMII